MRQRENKMSKVYGNAVAFSILIIQDVGNVFSPDYRQIVQQKSGPDFEKANLILCFTIKHQKLRRV